VLLDLDAAITALKHKEIVPGQVIVMRGAGACGGPAMGGGASRVVFAVDGAGLGDQVALLTDGHLSGLVCKGLVVAEVSPEAALGGPLGLVRDGDVITIDLDARRLDIALSDAELQARRADWQAPPPAFDTGWLQQYRRNVEPAFEGRRAGAHRTSRALGLDLFIRPSPPVRTPVRTRWRSPARIPSFSTKRRSRRQEKMKKILMWSALWRASPALQAAARRTRSPASRCSA
jgi:hypothetical protein